MAQKNRRGYYQFCTHNDKYKTGDFDLYAFVITEINAFYIVPFEHITVSTFYADPSNVVRHHSGNCASVIYRDRWDLLKT